MSHIKQLELRGAPGVVTHWSGAGEGSECHCHRLQSALPSKECARAAPKGMPEKTTRPPARPGEAPELASDGAFSLISALGWDGHAALSSITGDRHDRSE